MIQKAAKVIDRIADLSIKSFAALFLINANLSVLFDVAPNYMSDESGRYYLGVLYGQGDYAEVYSWLYHWVVYSVHVMIVLFLLLVACLIATHTIFRTVLADLESEAELRGDDPNVFRLSYMEFIGIMFLFLLILGPMFMYDVASTLLYDRPGLLVDYRCC